MTVLDACGRKRIVDTGVTRRRREEAIEVTSNSDSSVPSRLWDDEVGACTMSAVGGLVGGLEEEPVRLCVLPPLRHPSRADALKREACFPRKKRWRRKWSGCSWARVWTSFDREAASEWGLTLRLCVGRPNTVVRICRRKQEGSVNSWIQCN